MEKNNGRSRQGDVIKLAEPVKTESTQIDTAQYEKIINNLYARVKQLENSWLITRAEFLFKVLETPQFSDECKLKAREELEGFLFPTKAEVAEYSKDSK